MIRSIGQGIAGRTAGEIATSVEEQLAAGRLTEGSRLPTVRALAAQLEVSPATVASAYRALAARGLVSGRGRAGTTVTRHRSRSARRTAVVIPPGVLDLASGGPDPALLPDLRPALAAVAADLDPAGGRSRPYGEAGVLPELGEAVAGWLRAEGGPADEPSTGRGIAIVGGVLDGVERSLEAHLRPGDAVAVEDPAFSGVLDLLAALGLTPVPVPVDAAGMLPQALAGRLATTGPGRPSAAVLTVRAHNPTGAALTPQRARELNRVLTQYPDILLVEDDHLAAVAGTTLSSVAALGGIPRWTHVHGLAKTLGPDVRVAGLATDAVTAGRIRTRQQSGPGWVSWLLQRLALHLLDDPEHPARVVRAAAAYARRREALVTELEAHGIAVAPGSGLNVWVPVPQEARAIQTALAAGIAVRPGEAYRLGTGPAVRITTAGLDPDLAPRVAARLAPALSGAPGGEPRP